MQQRFRGTRPERAYAAWSALTDAEKAEYEVIKRTLAKFAKPNGVPDKPKRQRPPGSKRVPSAEVPGVNGAVAEGL